MEDDVLVRGRSVSPGIVTGRVRILQKTEDVHGVTQGDIAVVPGSNPAFAVGVMNSSGLVCEKGGALSHICIVSMEMGLPCITQAEGATEILVDNTMVTLDATNGVVYAVAPSQEGG